jgi:transketolase
MVHRANASHIGSVLSMADLLAELYRPGGRLRVDSEHPKKPDRDRFILSKGHACAGLYAALALRGFFPVSALQGYGSDDSPYMTHATTLVPGVELSTGSLGHGLPVGCGMAYGAGLRGEVWRTVVLLSDGEMDEGSNWEAILFAAHHALHRVWAIIDANGIQSLGSVDNVMKLEPLADKLRAFGWSVIEINGHDQHQIRSALDLDHPPSTSRPTAIIARTIKGKGISFMEGELQWHYRSPNKDLLEKALAELETDA